MDEILNLHIEISTKLKAMLRYWDYEMPDLRDHFDEVPEALTDVNDALDEAWEKFTDLMAMVSPVEDEDDYY